ncbi:hypothetical protein [Mangrovimonas sp. DI 80]|uniref:hypothetical protein n=1 Tax=Mangrovimonas sp. DI 80 TaxID=1779330 RepID=UPI0009772E2B|nr:hypothetical protein [Mangrovimonas sp. DI 80]OMP30680.1 hypothetical protein BKM32_10605 [Mangrovimonas sp. DI 80]
MKKLIAKFIVYTPLVLIGLEILVRTFNLTKDYPIRYVDEMGVEKWLPNQHGVSVTGIRRQNASEFRINNSGFNSYREYTPSKETFEIALVGDSFIEGFHQNYYNSIGKKIENKLNGIQVYEYGYAGYDLADELHLIHQYQEAFNLIDLVFISLEFETDLTRPNYTALEERMKLESPLYKALRQCKLLVYMQTIGILEAPKSLFSKAFSQDRNINIDHPLEKRTHFNLGYFENFKKLVNTYGFDKTRYIFLLDAEITPEAFLKYLRNNQFKYVAFSEILNNSKSSTTLLYDMHWNDHGRELIAKLISFYITENK